MRSTSRETTLPTRSKPLGAAGYRELVGRVREDVRRSVPEGATVLVVSRGDDALLRLGNRSAWHFPRTPTGLYAGHHPATGREAISHLEEQRRAGAEYLVFPATAFWWLGHYSELTNYLLTHCRLVASREESCVVFALNEPAGRGGGGDNGGAPDTETLHLARQLADLVDALLPKGIAVALLDSGGAERLVSHLELDGRPVWWLTARQPTQLEPAPQLDEEPPLVGLERFQSAGGRFLVIPRPTLERLWPRRLLEHLAPDRCLVTYQRHVCAIYDLGPDPNAARHYWKETP